MTPDERAALLKAILQLLPSLLGSSFESLLNDANERLSGDEQATIDRIFDAINDARQGIKSSKSLGISALSWLTDLVADHASEAPRSVSPSPSPCTSPK